MRNRILRTAVALLLVSFGLAALPAFAQTTGNVEGTVLDSNQTPLPGVSVELRSPSLQGVRTVVTDGAGRFRFPALPPGGYTVTAALSGFTKVEKTGVRVGLGATVTLPLVLSVSVKEEVVVTGEAPVVDTSSTTAGTNYTATVISKLPVGRNYADVVRLQPGVQTDSGETQGRSLALSIYGSTSAENLFLIDGVNTTNVIKGIQGKSVNNEFVEEVEVKTGGYQAEFGRNTGGVVNVITKQGGNEFHGNAFGYYENVNSTAKIKVDESPAYSQSGDVLLSNTYDKNTRWEAGASLGGFFLKDRIWFFGAYDKVKTDRITVPTGTGPTAGNQFPYTYDANLYSGKLTFNITQSTSLVASVFADPQTNDGAQTDTPSSNDPNTYNGTRDLGGTDYSIRLTQLIGSSGLINLQYGRHKESYLFSPQSKNIVAGTDTTGSLTAQPNVTFGGWGSVFGPTTNNESTRDAFKASVSLFFGKHEVKVGGDYQDDLTTGSTYYTGGQQLVIYPCTQRGTSVCDLTKAPFYTNYYGTRTQVFYRHRYYSPSGTDLTPMVESPFATPNKMYSFFAQDEWKVLPNLVVNLGIRYDDQKVYKGNNEVAFDLKDQWSPRIGFSWDFLNNGSSKVYGSYGRFHYATPTDLNVRVFTANTQVYNYNYSSTATPQDPTAPRRSLLQVGSFAGEPVDEGMKASYQDEYTIGIEKAIDSTFSLGAKYTYRSLGRTIEDRCDLDPSDPLNQDNTCGIMNPGSSGVMASGQSRTCNGSGNPTDPTAGECTPTGVATDPAKRIFRGIELVARKRFGDSLWAQASYLYSTLKGNYTGAISTQSGQTDPGINADYDYYQFGYNASGLLDLDRTHQFRVDASYAFPFGLSAGIGAFVRSGTPYQDQGWFNDFYTTELKLQERGSMGRTPTEWDADFNLAYNFKVGPVTISPMLYIFRVFNNQIITGYDNRFNPNGSFVTNPNSKFYGQAGVEPGTQKPDGSICTGNAPCSDNKDYMKAVSRTDPRALRLALKVAF